MTKEELRNLAIRLTLALADEVAFADCDAAEASLIVLEEATRKLNLQKQVEEIDTLSSS